jgi:hypothetical protein
MGKERREGCCGLRGKEREKKKKKEERKGGGGRIVRSETESKKKWGRGGCLVGEK